MEKILTEQNEYFQSLNNLINQSERNIMIIDQLMQELSNIIEDYSLKIEKWGEKFHLEISKTNDQDQLLQTYQLFSNYILKKSQNQKYLVKNIASEVMDPFSQFINNYKNTNKEIIQKHKEEVKKIEKSRVQLLKQQQEYLKCCKTSEKYSQKIESLLEKLEKNKDQNTDELQKVTQKQIESKILAEENMIQYKSEVNQINAQWCKFAKEFENLFVSYDFNEEMKVSFLNKSFQSLIRHFVSISRSEIEVCQQIEEKIQGQSKIYHIKSFSTVAKNKSIFFILDTQEQFLSYDQYKKEKNISDSTAKIVDGNDLIDKRNIDIFVNNLIDPSFVPVQKRRSSQQWDKKKPNPISQQQSDSHINIKDSQQSSISQNDSLKDNNNNNQKNTLPNIINTQNSTQTLKLFEKKELRQHFLRKIYDQIVKTQVFDFCEEKFSELQEVFSIIINFIEQQYDYNFSDIYYVIQLCVNLKHLENDNQSLGLQLAKKLPSYFLSKERWEILFNNLLEMKKDENVQEKSFKQKLKQLLLSNKNQNNDSSFAYLILEEINFNMSSINLPSDFCIDFIIALAKKFQIKQEQLINLLEKQEQQKSLEDLKTNFLAVKSQKQYKDNKYKSRLQTYNKKVVFCLKKSLIFLSLSDNPFSLMLINKYCSLHMQLYIFQFYLSQNEQYLQKYRVFIWYKITKCEQLDLNYVEIKTNVALTEKKSQIDDIIILDVQRSLHIHSQKINSQMLQSFLRTFSASNPDIQYCQGMNYLAGYIYLQFLDEEKAYKFFHQIMQKTMKQVFINHFEQLKQLFYQLNRLIQIFLPSLYQRFKEQKIDTYYFATSWIITLYTQCFQYTGNSYMLNIAWDLFLAYDWKGFFQFTIFLLKFQQEKLLINEFDMILHLMGEIIKSDLFLFSKEQLQQAKIFPNTDNLKSEIKKFKITNRLLNYLKEEYQMFIKRIKSKIEI